MSVGIINFFNFNEEISAGLGDYDFTGIWSLRKVLSGATSSIRIFRQSDSTQTDIGFVGNDLDGSIREESRYTKQMLTTIQGCLDIAGKNLEDRSVQAYLTNTFGEDNAQQILQERISTQDQLEQLFERIKNSNASNPSTDIKNPPTSSFNPPTGSIGEVSGSKS
jgi:hypothetical protein